MADPQVENGYIQIANEIVEAFIRHRISGREWQMLWVIIRKTWGFKKKMDKIALIQFSDATGLIRVNCQQALNSLLRRNMIFKTVTENSYRRIPSYGFNKDYDTWRLLPKTVTVTENSNKTVTENSNHKRKEINKRESSKKKSSLATVTENSYKLDQKNPDIKKFIDWWFEEWQRHFGEKYLVHGGKDGQTVKRLLAAYPFDRLIELAKAFFDSDDEFIRGSGYTIGAFSSVISKLIAHRKPETRKERKL